MNKNNLSAKEYSLLIEIELRKVNKSMYGKSDEILNSPYREIISAIEFRVPKEKFNKFKLYYRGINGQSLQKLIDDNYNIEQLLETLHNTVENH